ncbi:cell wall surface anchored protein [Streptococcus pneumoniae GA47976]|nr:cell wall surface anchored protein [Streptococcus pneumoniae GA47976]
MLRLQQVLAPQPPHQPVPQPQQVHQFQIQQTIRTHKLEMLLDRQVNPKKNCLIQVLSRQLDLCYLEF